MSYAQNDDLFTYEDIKNLPEGDRAELIDGDLFMKAAPLRIHQKLLMQLATNINNKIDTENNTCEIYPSPFAVFINGEDDNMNYVEPDISVICDPSKLTERGCDGAPDWIIEIVSPSSKQMDYIRKLLLYQEAGVREYWIVNPDKQMIRTYYFESEETEDHAFTDSVRVRITDDFSICISDLLQ